MTQDKQELEKTLIKNDGQQMSAIELQNQAKMENKVKHNAVQNKKFEIQM